MTEPHMNIETEVRELFSAKMREFAVFCAENWTITAREAETLTNPTTCTKSYARGYNDAISDGLSGALDHWLDEHCGYGR